MHTQYKLWQRPDHESNVVYLINVWFIIWIGLSSTVNISNTLTRQHQYADDTVYFYKILFLRLNVL